MLGIKPVMGWNTWNTFGEVIDEKIIMESADALVENGYKDAGYEYVIIDDCWSLRERVDGKLVPNPERFPHGMKYVADYVHSKGLKFGMYSCAGGKTCAGYPSSYGYEFEDAKQFAEWGVDYLKYDFCFFPQSGSKENAYLTMAMALRNCGRDIVFAACNWGVGDPWDWMRSRGAHTYCSTGDIRDNAQSYLDIFKSQIDHIGGNGAGCYNDMDMLIVGMRGEGFVGLGGCTTEEYLQHFAMWAFFGSPLIIGGDIRNLSDEDRAILQNKGLISINQDPECRPAFKIFEMEFERYAFMKLLDGGKFAVAIFNVGCDGEYGKNISVTFDDLGIHSNTPRSVKITDAITGEELGNFRDGIRLYVDKHCARVLIGEVCED